MNPIGNHTTVDSSFIEKAIAAVCPFRVTLEITTALQESNHGSRRFQSSAWEIFGGDPRNVLSPCWQFDKTRPRAADNISTHFS
jgi:hypothetical protein